MGRGAHSRQVAASCGEEPTPISLPNRAEQGPAADALQPQLVPRFGFQARLRPGVRRLILKYGTLACLFSPGATWWETLAGVVLANTTHATPEMGGSMNAEGAQGSPRLQWVKVVGPLIVVPVVVAWIVNSWSDQQFPLMT